ncbi:MAG: hypothetical protein IT349_01795 [Candidatus Eisenbacteria bacterium]|nr:hypothetical protein [Candidatus Eisenbacteria bacterium]MCC7140810.1 hypothetical protein [Candidatus Eisenbacteria bacterium]
MSRKNLAAKLAPSAARAIVLALTCTGLAWADLPDPTCVSVVPADALNGLVVGPNQPAPLAASRLFIEIKNNLCEAIADAQVSVQLTSANPLCPSGVLSGVTDSQGKLELDVAAGGCAHLTPQVGVIKANGVTIRSYVNVKSPDWDGATSDGLVNLADLLAFARQFNGQEAAECHDYTNDGVCDLSDLTIFGGAFSSALHCQ